MPFFTYRQNNSGGSFVEDAERGITKYVVIEAESFESANDRAEAIGLYFDEDCNYDCPCCGPRWSSAWTGEGDPEPMIYDDPVFTRTDSYRAWTEVDAYVHYLEGFMTPVHFKRDER